MQEMIKSSNVWNVPLMLFLCAEEEVRHQSVSAPAEACCQFVISTQTGNMPQQTAPGGIQQIDIQLSLTPLFSADAFCKHQLF